MHLTILVLVLLADLSFEKEYLSWKLLTNKIVFGQAIQLMCHLPKQNCCHNFTRSWEGGPDYKPLTLNEKSSNYTKYIEHLDAETCNSILTIKSFSESDVDILYQCSYGFSSYAAVLQLTKHRYEYHPTELLPVSLSLNGTHMYAKITLEKVFPKPQCYGHANEENITQESLKVISIRNGIFYKSMIGFNYMIDPHHCFGLVTIACTIGTSRITIAERNFACHKIVLIDVQEDRLVFGQTVELVCHLKGSLHLEDGSSRQWSGGAFNKVLSLNGYSSDINKYQEVIKSNTEFRLRVLNFNESDANQYYKCVYGFKYNEIKLDLKKKLYEYIPIESQIDTQFIVNIESEIVTTYVRFQKIFPGPQCVVYADKSSVNMTIESKTTTGLFLNVSLNSEMNSAECCGREITMICSVGTRKIVKRTMQIQECDDRDELVTLPAITVIVLPTVSIVILLLCSVSLVLVYKRKHKSDYSESSTSEC